MFKKIHFIDDDLPESIGHRLEAMLYGAPYSTAAYAIGLVIMTVALWLRTHDVALTGAAVACVAFLGVRVAYVAGAKPISDCPAPTSYLPILLVFGCGYSMLLAALVVLALADGDLVAISLVSVATAGYLSGVTIRAAALPTIAIPHASTLFAPLIVSAAIARGGQYWAAALLLACYWAGSVQLIVTTHRRIRAQLLAEHHLAQVAATDTLTGLANRRAFDGALDARLVSGSDAVIAIIDLDEFKAVNDTHGHDAGDELLKSVVARIETALAGQHLVARVGGDEFAVLFDTRSDVEDALRLGEEIVRTVEQPFSLTAANVEIGASVGLARATIGDSVRSLKCRADERLYHVKRNGRGKVAVAEASQAAA